VLVLACGSVLSWLWLLGIVTDALVGFAACPFGLGLVDCIGIARNTATQFVVIAGINSMVGRGSECRERRRFAFLNRYGIGIEFQFSSAIRFRRATKSSWAAIAALIIAGVAASSWTPTWAGIRLPMSGRW
jgi:hypothetical protein